MLGNVGKREDTGVEVGSGMAGEMPVGKLSEDDLETPGMQTDWEREL